MEKRHGQSHRPALSPRPLLLPHNLSPAHNRRMPLDQIFPRPRGPQNHQMTKAKKWKRPDERLQG